MGSTRRTTRHVEAIEAHGEQVRLFVLAVHETTEDGLVEPSEDQLLDRLAGEVLASYRGLPAEAAIIDTGVKIVGSMLNTMSPTNWVVRLCREGAEDEQNLIESGHLEPLNVEFAEAA